jgi:hypothetical protein
MRKLALAALLLTLACKKEEGVVADRRPAAGSENAAVAARVAQPLTGDAVSSKGIAGGAAASPLPPKAAAPDRMIVRTANVTLVVRDTNAVMEKITSAVEQSGGYVSGSNVWRDGEQTRGKLSLRVPYAALSQTLAQIRGLAVRIESETITTDEVTQEYVDLGSQLRNLEAAETELRQLMTTIRVNSKKASEVLEMYQELSTIRGQIEQTRGRMRYLEQMTSYATINAELVPDAMTKPVVEAGWQPVAIAKDAARALTNVLKEAAAAVIWIVVYVVPVMLLVGIALLAGWRVLRVLARMNAAQKV